MKLLNVLKHEVLTKAPVVMGVNVSFNQEKAKADLSAIADPVINFLFWGSTIFALLTVGVTFITWSMKDEDERAEKPFSKVVIGIVMALLFLAIGSLAVKWFVFS